MAEYSEEEKLLQKIQDECKFFADELLTTVCKRAIRTINSWPVEVIPSAHNYPNNFTTYDILSIEYQTQTFEEINPFIQNAIDGALSQAYDSLSPKDKFFIEYSECFYETNSLDHNQIDRLVHDRFIELLNEHYSNAKKIVTFELKRSW